MARSLILIFLGLALGATLCAQEIGSLPPAGKTRRMSDGTEAWSLVRPPSATATEVLAGGVFSVRYDPAEWTKQGYDENGILSFGTTRTFSEAWILVERNPLDLKDLRGHLLLSVDRLLDRPRLLAEDKRTVNGIEVQALRFGALVDGDYHICYVYLASRKAHTVAILVVVPSDDAFDMEITAMDFLNGLSLVTP